MHRMCVIHTPYSRGLRPGDATRLGDIVVLDFAAEGRYLIFDGVVTTVYRNSILSRVAVVPGYAAKMVEDKKFKADSDSLRPLASIVGGRPTLVPFAMEDGGRLGAHAQAALGILAQYVVAKGRLPPRARHMAVALPLWKWHYGLVGDNIASLSGCI